MSGTLSIAAYGHEVTSENDELVANMDEVSHITNATGSPGSTPVDFFPICTSPLVSTSGKTNRWPPTTPIVQYFPTWLPGMQFMNILRKGRAVAEKALTTPVDLVRKDRVSLLFFGAVYLGCLSSVFMPIRRPVLRGSPSYQTYWMITK